MLSHFSRVWLFGLYPTRLLCPWDSLGKNTGMDCHALLQEILTKGSNLSPLHLLLWQAGSLPLASTGKPLGDWSKKILIWLMSKSVVPMFASRIFKISGLLFRSLIHSVYICIWHEKKLYFHYLTCSYPVYPAPLIEETVLSWSSNSTPGHISKENKNSNLKRFMYPNAHSSNIYNSKLYQRPMFTDQWMDIEYMVNVYNGLL